MMKQKYQAYAAATQTVARTRQIVLLYDGTIRFLQQAKEAIRDNQIEDRYRLVARATEVITGLQGCLDFENGGDIAKLLYQFYASIENRLYSIHHSNSIETCDEVIAELKQMRDVWHEIDHGAMQPGTKETSESSQEHSAPIPVNDPSAPVTFSA